MSRTTRSRVLPLGVVGALVVAAACTDSRSTVLEPQAVQYGFALLPDGRNVPSGTAVFQRPATSTSTADTAVILTLRGLDSLTTKFYQVWLVDTATTGTALTNVIKATGNLRIIRTDSSLDANGDVVATRDIRTVAGVSSFQNGGPATQVELTVTRATSGVGATAPNPFVHTIVLVTLEDSANAAAPGTIRPLWARRAVAAGSETGTPTATSTATVRFGNFAPRPADEYRFVATGRGRGAFGDRFVVFDDSSLTRPPVGYYYAGVVIKRDSANKAVDTLQLGPQTAPVPRRNISLYDADITILDAVVKATPPSIVAAANRVSVDTVTRFQGNTTPFRGFTDAYVTLESKYGVPNAAAPTIVLSGSVPTIVRYGPAKP